jgi:glycosyltransferase involved in cell wall biosynthesis
MKRDPCHITVVVTAHREGRLAHHTMRSLFRSKDYAEESGLSVEVVVVMDRPSRTTEDYFSRYTIQGMILRQADFGDLGLSRNFGISLASGQYVAIVDADNMVCRNWLCDAFRYLRTRGREVVAHPEYQMVFEARNFLFRQISSVESGFRFSNIIEYNYWDSVCVAAREIFLRHPYEETTGSQGFGFEDWHWNCETLADGIEHHVVPNTVHFMRMKRSGSLLTSTQLEQRIIRPSRLFDPLVFSSLVDRERSKE